VRDTRRVAGITGRVEPRRGRWRSKDAGDSVEGAATQTGKEGPPVSARFVEGGGAVATDRGGPRSSEPHCARWRICLGRAGEFVGGPN
jgi:hypothetical protein